MKLRAALVEFSILQQFPLISGYLHAYAAADAAVAECFEFVYYQEEIGRTDYSRSLSAIRALDAELVCLSAYVWNMGLVVRLVNDLQNDSHVRHIILGGHQISHQIRKYIDRRDEKTIVVNGQGEIAFRSLLQRLAAGGELPPQKGISFYRGGELCDGGEAEMLTNLDDIPSPFLSGQFDGMKYPVTVFETNRGCPYKCTFCTWGGDTMKVTKFSLDRIKDELLWIAKKPVLHLSIGDANWGMLSRDIEISEHIAKLRRRYGAPYSVTYASAKNKPKGSLACIKKFREGGLISSQAIGVQSLNPATLSLVERENIKTSAFAEILEELNREDIDSICELIWPLPGETIDTLTRGFGRLVELGARTTIMYPAVLINNAKLTEQAGEFQMECVNHDDWMSELKIVKATKFAERRDVESGFWFYYSYFLLGNCDFHKALLRYCRQTTGSAYSDIVTRFADELRAKRATSAYGQTIDDIFKHEAFGSDLTTGRLAAHLAHEKRVEAIIDVARFIFSELAAVDAQRNLAMIGLWAFSFPRLFSDTKDGVEPLIDVLEELAHPHGLTFSSLASVKSSGRNITLSVDDSAGVWSDVVKLFGVVPNGVISKIEVRHPTTTFLRYDQGDSYKNNWYAYTMIVSMGRLVPEVRVLTSGALFMPNTAYPPVDLALPGGKGSELSGGVTTEA